MNKAERVRLYHQKIASSLLDKRQRQRDEEKLDDYGVAMSFDPVKTPEEAMIEREECEAVAKAMLRLPPRREYVVRAHYGINVEPQTLKEIGETFGITNSAIQVIEYKALRSLSHPKSGLLRKLRPEKYAKERARLDAWAKQDAEAQANYARQKAEEWKLQYEAQQAEAAVGAAEAAAADHDATTRVMLEGILADEEKHLAWLESERALLNRLGEPLYFANRMGDPPATSGA